MRTLILSVLAAMTLISTPALAGGPGDHGGGGHPGGGHPGGGYPGGCGGGCGGGYSGGGHPGGGGGYGGGNTNVNVNVNANANAYATAYAGAGAFINARGYDTGIRSGGGRAGGFTTYGSGYGGWDTLGYGGSAGAVYVSGPGYGPSRPYGYTVRGFGRSYVTTDRGSCGGCGAPPPPPPSCDRGCGGGYDHGGRYSNRGRSDYPDYGGCGCSAGYSTQAYAPPPVSYARNYGYQGAGYSSQTYESYSEQTSRGAYQAGYQGDGYQGGYAGSASVAPPQVYFETQDGGYAQAGSAAQAYSAQTYEASPAQVMPQPPVYVQAPAGYYGDLPPGGEDAQLPPPPPPPPPHHNYRQEPGERG